MRIDRVYIDGFRNLHDVEASFDEGRLTTVIIGQNGSGKSNLIEAIVEIFRHVDLPTGSVRFTFEIDYVIRGRKIRVHNRDSMTSFVVDGEPMSFSRFNLNKKSLFPDLVFGYYSGTGRRLEKLFDDHQARYYSVINKDRDDSEYAKAKTERRLFYCRPVHGVFGLLAHFAKPGKKGDVSKLLNEKLGITGFHSALAHFKEPSWFNHATWKKGRKPTTAGRGRRTFDDLGEQALDIWGAKGPAGECARAFQKAAFHPLAITGKVVDDYRSKAKTEAQLACFIRDQDALNAFATQYGDDQDLFAGLEAADISDLFRDMLVWVTRKGNDSGDVSFADLSDGERQLLMVLGLIRVSRGSEAVFLLDEPDTHLNPAWQLTYLDLIKEWTEIAADEDKCQIIMTSHNPLTIAALVKQEVRVLQVDDDAKMKVTQPYADPRGMGFTATLTEIFGLPTTLDPGTQRQIDERNTLAKIEQRTKEQEKQLIEINDKLNRLGFTNESREPLYQDFLRAWHDVRYADRPPMTPEDVEGRHNAMQLLIKQLTANKGGAY
ncbi:AAA family ATPase [Rhizobium phaseoli]|uniref:AAA family ATPase n=1 Tax=Rhizobium phaseoli TaxID=396 RepID=UPI0002E787C7|nr:AAA family ATPase [Rhizobium phaseoli]KKZ84833.1 AAA ATPase [Rhizobium phaseoli Ch24-10]RDJ02104.1 AAA family ATPase [Rhizobium phaseoli]RDJ02161.1 AAA family ATPase [Rhizobium phaseoli]